MPRPISDVSADKMSHRTLVAGTGVVLGMGSVVVHLFTGFPLGILLGGAAGLTILMATVGWWAIGLLTDGLSHMLTASGGLPRQREYSEQQTLEVRGHYLEAAESYRGYLVAFPDDQEARLRLAALTAGPLGDPDGAEALYRVVRASGPTPMQEMVVANALIDLHRAAGDGARLRAELDRFARRFAGTAAGEAARRQLRHGDREDG